MANIAFDEVIATQNYFMAGKHVVAIHNGANYLGSVTKLGGKQTIDGGEKIYVQTQFTEGNVSFIQPGAERPPRNISKLDAPEFEPAYLAGDFSVLQSDLLKANGPQKRIDLLKFEVQALEESNMDLLNRAMLQSFTDGITPLTSIVHDSNTYGNVNRSTAANSWLRSIVDSTAGVFNMNDFDSVFNQSTRGGKGKPNLIVMARPLYEKYTADARTAAQISMNTKAIAELGFQGVEYRGIPVIYDEGISGGTVYILEVGPKNVVLGVWSGGDFKMSPAREAEDFYAIFMKSFWMGQHFARNPRQLGVMQNRTKA